MLLVSAIKPYWIDKEFSNDFKGFMGFIFKLIQNIQYSDFHNKLLMKKNGEFEAVLLSLDMFAYDYN